MTLANSGSTEEVLAAFFYGREDIIPEMFRRLLKTPTAPSTTRRSLASFHLLHRSHIELGWRQSWPMGRKLLDDLVANSPQGRASYARRVQQH